MKKKMLTMVCAVAMAVGMTSQAFAGQWLSDAKGWWWQYSDGTYPVNRWEWLDGNGDGTAECYYFNGEGYCLMNAVTPDNYTVNENGAWVIDGAIQVSQIDPNSDNSLHAAAPQQNNPQKAQDNLNLWTQPMVKYNQCAKLENAKDAAGNSHDNVWRLYATNLFGWDGYVCYENEHCAYDYITVTYVPSDNNSSTAMGQMVVGDYNNGDIERIEDYVVTKDSPLQTVTVYIGDVEKVVVGLAHEYGDMTTLVTDMYFHN